MTSKHFAIGALTDYVIGRFRCEFGLWYDVNDHGRHPMCENDAQLFDGENVLFLSFAINQSIHDAIVTFDVDKSTLQMSGFLREDSRVHLSREELSSAAISAVGEFNSLPTEKRLAPNVALLSFEIHQIPLINRTSDWLRMVAQSLGGEVQECPTYRGGLTDQANFFIEEEPETRWSQIVLHGRNSEKKVTEVLERHVLDTNDFRTGTNNLYRADKKLATTFGIKAIRILARRF